MHRHFARAARHQGHSRWNRQHVLRRSVALVLFCVLGEGLWAPAALAATAESRVAASADDAEENASGSVSVVGSDLELGWDGSAQTLGIRFPGLAVPQGAAVREAWIQFESDEVSTNPVSLTFQAQAADAAPSFTTASRNLSTRTRSPGSVPWIPSPWTAVGVAGPEQRSPDLSALVQAVVDRPGWVSGNALVLLVNGDATNGRRIARSWNTDPSGAPLLHVAYELEDVDDPPTLAMSGAPDRASGGSARRARRRGLGSGGR